MKILRKDKNGNKIPKIAQKINNFVLKTLNHNPKKSPGKPSYYNIESNGTATPIYERDFSLIPKAVRKAYYKLAVQAKGQSRKKHNLIHQEAIDRMKQRKLDEVKSDPGVWDTTKNLAKKSKEDIKKGIKKAGDWIKNDSIQYIKDTPKRIEKGAKEIYNKDLGEYIPKSISELKKHPATAILGTTGAVGGRAGAYAVLPLPAANAYQALPVGVGTATTPLGMWIDNAAGTRVVTNKKRGKKMTLKRSRLLDSKDLKEKWEKKLEGKDTSLRGLVKKIKEIDKKRMETSTPHY